MGRVVSTVGSGRVLSDGWMFRPQAAGCSRWWPAAPTPSALGLDVNAVLGISATCASEIQRCRFSWKIASVYSIVVQASGLEPGVAMVKEH